MARDEVHVRQRRKDASPSTFVRVKWSDGTPFTSADVAYTFDLLNKVPATDNYGAPAMSSPATTPNKYTVVLHYTNPEYLNITTIAGAVLIVQQDSVVQDQEPGDSGRDQGSRHRTLRAEQLLVPAGQVLGEPALLGWQARRARGERRLLLHQHGSGHGPGRLVSCTWAGNDIANVNSIFVDKDTKTNHTYFAPGITVTLWFKSRRYWSFELTPSFAKPSARASTVRRCRVEGESGYEQPATSSSGLILPAQAALLESSLKNDLPATAGPRPGVRHS